MSGAGHWRRAGGGGYFPVGVLDTRRGNEPGEWGSHVLKGARNGDWKTFAGMPKVVLEGRVLETISIMEYVWEEDQHGSGERENATSAKVSGRMRWRRRG